MGIRSKFKGKNTKKCILKAVLKKNATVVVKLCPKNYLFCIPTIFLPQLFDTFTQIYLPYLWHYATLTFELGPRLNRNSRSNSFDQLREATLASLGEPQPRVRARHRTLAYGVDELDLDKWVVALFYELERKQWTNKTIITIILLMLMMMGWRGKKISSPIFLQNFVPAWYYPYLLPRSIVSSSSSSTS